MKVIPREVRKVVTHSRELRELRANSKLTEIQKQVIIGTMLGDACLIPNAWGKGYRLQIEQGANQKDYCFWKYEILKDFVRTEPQFKEKSKSWRFRTISCPEFTELASKWYNTKRCKQLPKEATYFIARPLTFAIWYMDDGGLRKERGKIYGAFLNTQSFSLRENKVLQHKLEKSYGINSLLLSNHGKLRIYIPRRSLETLRSVIEPHIHHSMQYKLP